MRFNCVFVRLDDTILESDVDEGDEQLESGDRSEKQRSPRKGCQGERI